MSRGLFTASGPWSFDWRPLYAPLTILGCLALGAIWLMPGQGYDFLAYWSVAPLDPYAARSELGAFRYAPPSAMLMAPMSLLPFERAYIAWLALDIAALWYIARRWMFALILFPPVFADLAFGNIHVLYGAMIVAGRRHPAVWVFGLMTKITPGIGVIWYTLRGEWRALVEVAGITMVAVGLSLVLQGPAAWDAWLRMLGERDGYATPWAMPVPLVPRLVLAFALIGWGARTDRPWTVPLAVCLSIPTWYWSGLMLAPLVALWPTLPARMEPMIEHSS